MFALKPARNPRSTEIAVTLSDLRLPESASSHFPVGTRSRSAHFAADAFPANPSAHSPFAFLYKWDRLRRNSPRWGRIQFPAIPNAKAASYAFSHGSKSRRMRTYAKRGGGWGARKGENPQVSRRTKHRRDDLSYRRRPTLTNEGWGTRKPKTGV